MARFVPVGQEDPMSTLCRMVVDIQYDDLPENVINHTKQCILEAMAATVGGSTAEGIPEIVDFVKNKGGKPEFTLPFYGYKVPASEAGLALGPMTRALELVGGHYEGGHSVEYTVPALLAATGLKSKVTGKEFITAYVVGEEVLSRIGMAFKQVSQAIPNGCQGGHYILGCIAAVGKLLGLNFDDLENAEGIGRGVAQPYDSAMYQPPTLMVRVHHGFVCRDAINACLLAQAGITGPRGEVSNVITGPRGYLSLAHWQTEPDLITRDLGDKWEMLHTLMKPYSSCGCTHTAISGVLDQISKHNIQINDIAGIDIDVSRLCWSVVCTPKDQRWNPETIHDCQFSLPYTVATAIYVKDVFLDAYTPEARARKDVRELMPIISAREVPDLPSFASRVHLTLKDGTKYSEEYFYYTEENPQVKLTEQQLINKFKKCVPYAACEISDKAADSVIEAILNLEKVDDVVGSMLTPLTPE